MSRPKSKSELLELSEKNFQKLLNYINELSVVEQQQEFPVGTLNRNIRDVLAHLHHWHTMMNLWYQEGMSRLKPVVPAKGYTWKTTSDLNKWIQKKYSETALEEVKNMLSKSHDQVRVLILGHTDEELFEKKRYHWTGTTSLGAYLISATSSHYDWAFKLIKKARK